MHIHLNWASVLASPGPCLVVEDIVVVSLSRHLRIAVPGVDLELASRSVLVLPSPSSLSLPSASSPRPRSLRHRPCSVSLVLVSTLTPSSCRFQARHIVLLLLLPLILAVPSTRSCDHDCCVIAVVIGVLAFSFERRWGTNREWACSTGHGRDASRAVALEMAR